MGKWKAVVTIFSRIASGKSTILKDIRKDKRKC
jgi:hypothetical protein